MKFSAYEFATYVDRLIESYPQSEYLLRKGRDKKKVIEEFYPLSRLGLFHKRPGLDVQIEAHENTDRPDGFISVKGFHEIDFRVEVTFAGYDYEEALRSELLVRQGFVPGTGQISKDRKSGVITAVTTAEDANAPMSRLATSIRERFLAKSLMSYPDGTVLLIAFEDFKLCGRGWWSMLHAEIDRIGGIEKSIFAKIFLFNGHTNELLQVA